MHVMVAMLRRENAILSKEGQRLAVLAGPSLGTYQGPQCSAQENHQPDGTVAIVSKAKTWQHCARCGQRPVRQREGRRQEAMSSMQPNDCGEARGASPENHMWVRRGVNCDAGTGIARESLRVQLTVPQPRKEAMLAMPAAARIPTRWILPMFFELRVSCTALNIGTSRLQFNRKRRRRACAPATWPHTMSGGAIPPAAHHPTQDMLIRELNEDALFTTAQGCGLTAPTYLPVLNKSARLGMCCLTDWRNNSNQPSCTT